jgi:hypothetical protein
MAARVCWVSSCCSSWLQGAPVKMLRAYRGGQRDIQTHRYTDRQTDSAARDEVRRWARNGLRETHRLRARAWHWKASEADTKTCREEAAAHECPRQTHHACTDPCATVTAAQSEQPHLKQVRVHVSQDGHVLHRPSLRTLCLCLCLCLCSSLCLCPTRVCCCEVPGQARVRGAEGARGEGHGVHGAKEAVVDWQGEGSACRAGVKSE